MTTFLPPCPDSPNCVSSESQDTDHYVPPLSYTGSMAEAKATLLTLFEGEPRTRIMSTTEDHLTLEITSFLFRFIDDVEFAFDDHHKLIHVRSASRTGYWDLGVNRKRIERIRHQFQTP